MDVDGLCHRGVLSPSIFLRAITFSQTDNCLNNRMEPILRNRRRVERMRFGCFYFIHGEEVLGVILDRKPPLAK